MELLLRDERSRQRIRQKGDKEERCPGSQDETMSEKERHAPRPNSDARERHRGRFTTVPALS